MKSTLIFICGIMLSISAKAQLAKPVKWSFKAEKISTIDYKATLTATIDEGWYVYSQDISDKRTVAT